MVAANNTKQVSIASEDLPARLAELLTRVAAGEEFILTRAGTPVARVGPVQPPHDPEKVRQAIAEMRELSKGMSLGGLKIKDLMNEGRR
ncbi:antitoxin [Phycisphaerae bacterium]|jgi:prevent-host-death family protein|nr:antitoxin [Phycisphaerae bacterium]